MWGCFSNLFSSFCLKIIIVSTNWFSPYTFCLHSQPGVFRRRCSTLGADCPRSCVARLSVRSSVWRWGRRWQTSCLTLSRPSASPRAPTLPHNAVLVSASNIVFLTSNRPATSHGTLTLPCKAVLVSNSNNKVFLTSNRPTASMQRWLYHVKLSWSASINKNVFLTLNRPTASMQRWLYHVKLSWSATATRTCSWLWTVQQHPCSADSTM